MTLKQLKEISNSVNIHSFLYIFYVVVTKNILDFDTGLDLDLDCLEPFKFFGILYANNILNIRAKIQ